MTIPLPGKGGNYVPADAAEYLEGDPPRYQSGGKWIIKGKPVDMNKLVNRFDPPPPKPKT